MILSVGHEMHEEDGLVPRACSNDFVIWPDPLLHTYQ